jgi:hypothetical protein
MADKSEALRLADFLDDQYDPSHNLEEAAAELRRLHGENERLKTEKTELLEALREAALALAHATETMPVVYEDDYNRVSAAIARAEGEQK